MTAPPLLDLLQEQLSYAVAGSPDQYVRRLLEKRDIVEKRLNPFLFSAYELGRDANNEQLQEASRTFLRTRLPDLEQRLPFYEVMFDITDKGQFRRGDGTPSYELTEQLSQQLSQKLVQWAGATDDDAHYYIRRFRKDLASRVGLIFMTMGGAFLPQQKRVLDLADLLHRPMNTLYTVEEEKSIAGALYETTVLGSYREK